MSAKIEDGLIISYLTLRKAIGFLGLLWPFVLALGGMIIFGTTLQDTISAYYYTPMFGVFVGTLWAVGFFLFTYNGYDNNRYAKDWIFSRVAWVCALGSALFPTHKDASDHSLAGYLHLVFAGTLFLIFIVTIVSFGISWLVKGEFLFKDSTAQPPETPKAKPASASV